MKRLSIFLPLLLWANLVAQEPRNFTVDDALALKEVSDPQLSPDGEWVAYVLRELDLKEDTARSDIYMVPFAGGDPIRLTSDPKSDSHPRWSPDGRYLAFLSSRKDDKSQIWLLDRRGGEPFQLSRLKSGAGGFEWSPDSKHLVTVSKDPDPDEPEDQSEEKKKTKPPLVITRLQFKRDGEGYLTDRRNHLYTVAVEGGEAKQITDGPYDDSQPRWSPDGKNIAFVSNRTPEPDSNDNSDIFLVSAQGGEARQLTTNPGPDRRPAWSPDGRQITYVSHDNPEMVWYAVDHLAVIDVEGDGGAARWLTEDLDRNVSSPAFSGDGRHVYFLLEDSGNVHLARVSADGSDSEIERVVAGDRSLEDFHAQGDSLVLQLSEPTFPARLFAHDGEGRLRPLTSHNQKLLHEVRLGEVENLHFQSAKGVEIEGFATKPPGFSADRRYPTILWIHGGPVAQYDTGFNTIWQVFAGAGYLVVSANPRGSSGYGEDFSHAIWADWGNKDYVDVMAAVDHVIEKGYADPDNLGVGGWSYGGILTNYVITKTGRFKAAISGASEVDYLSCYGTDHYQSEWERELGLPWENRDLYLRMSPISYIDQVVTPTLVLCGELDWNVPLSQSEQLYQSLRRLGVETTLIIYPGQSHGIRKPTYQKDRYERFIGWFDKYLK